MTGYNPAELLDQLMGPNRNLAPGEKPKQTLQWSDARVCKNFLCGFCPYELFTNTKSDLGNCGLVHDEKLRTDYESAPEYGKLGYEETFFNFISKILNDCERKIARGYERLRNRRPIFLDPADQEAYDKLNEKMNATIKKIEAMGTKGSVEEATYAMQDVEEMKCELNIIAQRANNTTRFGYDREMEVCAVCGSLTLVNDLPSRFEDHINGRQHLGFSRIRQQVKLMHDSKYWKKRPQNDSDDERDKKKISDYKRRRSRSRDRSSRKSRSRDRSRKKSDEKRSKKSRSRSPKRHKSKDKYKKKDKRSRSHSMEKSRDKHRKDRRD